MTVIRGAQLRMQKIIRKEYLKKTLKIILIAILVEVFVFNFRHWESILFRPITNYEVLTGEGIEWYGDGRGKIINVEQAFLEFKNINKNVKNLFIDLTVGDGKASEKMNLAVRATDSANKNYFLLPEKETVNGIINSKYIRLHLSGKSTAIKINFLANNESYFKINGLSLNTQVPFDFIVIRFFIILLGFLYFASFVEGKWLFCEKLNLSLLSQRYSVAFCIVLQILFIFYIGQTMQPSLAMPEFIKDWPAHSQYNELADALMNGQVFLERKPPESLSMMENPYDPTERHKVVIEEHMEKFDWDYAYYNGNYYSYFGIIPAILFFVPYKIITGSDLKTWDLVTSCGIMYCIAAFFMMFQFVKKYFKETSLGMYLLMSSFYIWGSAIVYLVHFGNIYSCPIMVSLLLGTLGIGYYLSASDGITINRFRLTIGAVLIALMMGCRPHLAIVMFFAFPIFANEIVKKRLFFSKAGVVNTCCVMVPFLIIGTFLMYYNYVRFGSVFDFGANYNLTSNDMTHRGFVFERWPLGIFEYLFQPIRIKPQFPFWQLTELSNDYMGYTSYEFIICGFLPMNPIVILNFSVFKMKKILKKYKIFELSILCLMCSFIILLADIQLSGITQRYMSDFGWLLILNTVLILFSLEMILNNRKEMLYFHKIVAVLVGVSIFLNIYNLFIIGRYGDLINMNPFLYYTVKYWMPLY